jgi:muramoyltetrapeptide carboxypeptidase
MRIAVVAPGTPIADDVKDRVEALGTARYPGVEIAFHPQCFLRHGHFAGEDSVRAAALVEVANDRQVDAVWVARGGYGACRIAEDVVARLEPQARDKAYLGYSDAGYLLAGLHRAGFGNLAHGPMAADIRREGGETAVLRALSWLVDRSEDALEANVGSGPAIAFNLTVLSQLLGTPLEPDLAGQVLMLEDVSEYTYRTDRTLFHVTGNASVRRAAGIRFGRCSDVPMNDPDFGADADELVRYWCRRSGIPFLGGADIGHDAGNKVVPFGRRA